ncbi:MAG: integrase core domain-containing protein [Candidatus Cardinium sp.]|uniref:integrase core domain-containing protein n=1 Tax=Candidatus Cardinium sp. TP TaxID=2961955 RepID=UPI0021AE9417|nr:integrase core domain-containing protein [Candidatus Cardinium sp. TP]MCT4697192.1 integrase core domain-containing protein [Candidatus Cardinium sp. TP]
MVHFIKFRPIKPKSPHLNGKVERSQQTDKVEFYHLLNLKDASSNLPKLLSEWEYFYNHKRPHSALEDKTPWGKFKELEAQTPIQPDVTQMHWDRNGHILPRSSKYLKWKRKMSHFC